jgi:hypothetical protein
VFIVSLLCLEYKMHFLSTSFVVYERIVYFGCGCLYGLIVLNLDLTYNNYVFPSFTSSISKNINV